MNKLTRFFNSIQNGYQGLSDAIENRTPAPTAEPSLPSRQPTAEATELAETRVSIADVPDSPRTPEPNDSPRSTASRASSAGSRSDNDDACTATVDVADELSTENAAGSSTRGTLTRRRATTYVALTGMGGGLVHGIDAYLANTQAGEAGAKRMRDAMGLFTQVLGSSTVAVAKGVSAYVMPTSWVHAGEVWSYRLASDWGYMTSVPKAAREFFRNWMPGASWPDGCARPLGPSRPLPAWCPDLGLASVQRTLLPWTIGASCVMWGTLAGATLGAAVLYTPLGKRTRNAVPEWAWNRARIVVPATVGILVLLPFELAGRT